MKRIIFALAAFAVFVASGMRAHGGTVDSANPDLGLTPYDGPDPAFVMTFDILGDEGYADIFATGSTVTSGTLNITAAEDLGDIGTYSLVPNGSAPSSIVSPDGLWVYDNQLYYSPSLSDPFLDGSGLLFVSDSDPDHYINLWGIGPGSYAFGSSNDGGYVRFTDAPGTASLQSVPLPGALALLLAGTPGLAGIGWFLRRKQKAAEPA